MGPLGIAAINAAVPAGLDLVGGMFGGRQKASASDSASAGRREMRNQRRIINMQNKQTLKFLPRYAKAQTKAEKTRLEGIVANASASGFNPLTLLGAGTQQYPMGGMGGAIAPPPIQPGLGDAVGNALSTAARNFHYDPVAARTQELENEVLEARLGQIAQEDARQGVPALPRKTRRLGQPISPSDPETTTTTVETTSKPGVDDETTPLMMQMELPDKSIREVPIGMDWDEFVMGMAIFGYDKVRDGVEFMRDAWRTYQAENVKPIPRTQRRDRRRNPVTIPEPVVKPTTKQQRRRGYN